MTDYTGLEKVGYWYSKKEPHFPIPEAADEFEYKDSKETIIEYLKSGKVKHSWRGSSSCRICDKRPNGTKCLTDGKYIWPEGLAHYVRKHNTPLPTAFIEHIINRPPYDNLYDRDGLQYQCHIHGPISLCRCMDMLGDLNRN